MQFLYKLQSAFSRILSWFNILFGMATHVRGLSPLTYRIIHYSIVILITVLLAWFSPRIADPANLANWDPPRFVQRYYAGIVFVLFYVFVRMLLYFISLFRIPEVSEFEDIDRAWNAGLDVLAREGLDLKWLPVFVVAGLTDENERNLFRASRIDWKVIAPGQDQSSAPLRFYASEDALFVSLPDVGAMARQLRKDRAAEVPVAAAMPVHPEDIRNVDTLRHDQLAAAIQPTARVTAGVATPEPAFGATLLPSQRLGATLQPGAVAAVATAVAPRNAVPEKLRKDELELNRRRLEYFCRLLATERGDYCPVNGVMQVIPLRWSTSQAYQSLFQSVKQDLQVLHGKLRMVFPVVCVHAGLEELTGLRDLIERGGKLDPRFRDSRAGSRFPAGAPIDEESSKWVIDCGLKWFRDWIYAEFAKDLSNAANRHLFQLICDLDVRRQRLVRELALVFGELSGETRPRLSGCYYSAIGPTSQTQAFVRDVLQKLINEQNEVSWTPERLREDRRHRALGWMIGLAAVLLTVADGYLFWRVWSEWGV